MLELNRGSYNRSWLPSLDLHEEDGELVLHADLVDFDERIEISLEGGDLVVHAGEEPSHSSRLPLPFALRSLPAVSRGHEVLEVRIPIPEM
jgi:HSP20 family molecular chaperone IbpA